MKCATSRAANFTIVCNYMLSSVLHNILFCTYYAILSAGSKKVLIPKKRQKVTTTT